MAFLRSPEGPHRDDTAGFEPPAGHGSWPSVGDALERDAGIAERRGVLRRTLRGLSDRQLGALSSGLDRYRAQLVPGRLFRAGHGACAVGVMLFELQAVPTHSLAFWLHHRWRRSSTSYGAARSQPRLRHLEWTFDRSVERLRRTVRSLGTREAAAAVGDWFATEAQREVDWRRLARATSAGGWPDDGPREAAHELDHQH